MADSTSVGSLHYDLSIDDSKLSDQLNDADGNVSSFADKLHDHLQTAAKSFAVIGAGLTLVAKNATDYTVQATKDAISLGREIGVSTEQASQLTAAFARMGISAQSAGQMFGIFSKQIVAATKDSQDQAGQVATTQIAIDKTKLSIQQTTAEMAKSGDKSGELGLKLRELNDNLKTETDSLNVSTNAFQKLGVSTVDSGGKQKDFNTILFEVADKFQAMPDGIDKTADAMALFGRSGKDMIKVLNLGSAGIQDLEAQAEKLGLTLTPQTITKVEAYIQSQKDLKQSTDAVKIAIGTATAPVLTKFNETLNEAVLKLLGASPAVKNATADFIAFGGPVFGAAAAFFSFSANVAQALPELIKVKNAIRDWTAAQFALDVVLDANPIGLFILGITALVAAIVFALAYFNQIKVFFQTDLGIAVSIALAVLFPLIGLPLLIVTQWQTVKAIFIDIWNWVVANWPLLIGALLSPFTLAVSAIRAELAAIRGAVTGAASDAWNWLYKAGTDIVGGLVQGIKDKVGDAVNAVKNVGKSVINAARSALDWHSPSKVFVEAGKSITQGLALGIGNNTRLALGAMDKLSGAVIAPTMNLTGAGAGGGNTTNTASTEINIGQINNSQDEAFVLRRLDRNQVLEGMGMSPAI